MPEPQAPPRPEACRRSPLWWRVCGHTGRACRNVLVVLLVLLLAAACWVHVVGLPGFCLRYLKELAAGQGLHLDAHAIHLKWHRGLVAQGVVLFSPEDRITPAARARDLQLNVALLRGVRTGEWLEGLELSGAELRDPFTRDTQHSASLESLRLSLRFTPGGFTLSKVGFLFHGLALEGRGTYRYSDDHASTGPTAERAVPSLADIHRELKKIEPILSILSRIQFSSSPRIGCEFHIDEQNPALSHVDVLCDYTEGAVFEGCRFDGLQFHAEFKDEQIQVNRVRLAVPGGFARAELAFDSRLRLRAAAASLDLDETQIRTLLPDELAEELARGEVKILGRVAGSLSYSNSVSGAAASAFSASVDADHVTWRDIPLWSFEGSMERSPGYFSARIPGVRVGSGPGAGPVSAEITLDRRNGFYEGEVKAQCSPREMLAAARDLKGLQKILGQVDFKSDPGLARVAFSGDLNDDKAFWLSGPIQGTNLVFRGVPFDSLNAWLTLSNRNVRLSGVEARQAGEPVSGWLHILRDPDEVRLDVRGSVQPAALAHLIGPSFERVVSRFRLEPPFNYWTAGKVDTGRGEAHHLQGELMCGRIGYERFDLEKLFAFWTLTGNLLTLPHVEGNLDGGRISGLVQIADLHSDSNRYFFAEARPDRVSLDRFLDRLRVSRGEREMGLLSGLFSLEGRTGPDWAASLKGTGEARIQDGKLFQIAFFGGLSKVLSAIIPGFGYAQQTELKTLLAVGDSKVTLSETRLLGNVISAIASGTVGFDRRLNVLVQVKLMKEGFIAKAVQIISWPITKLFEFKLIGTLDQPDWRPDNLPKELFLKFD